MALPGKVSVSRNKSMKSVKIVLSLLTAALVLTVIIVIFVLSNLNTIIKDTVETAGREVTQADTQLESVDVKLTDGRIMLNGLSVANPAGFGSSQPILAVQSVNLHIDFSTLLNPVKVIDEVIIDGVEIVVEHKNIKDTNIQVMIDNIDSSSAENSQSIPSGANTQANPEESRFMIKKLTFANSSATLVSQEWGSRNFQLPGFNKTDIGDEAKGLTVEQLADNILSAYMAHIKEMMKEKVEELAKAKFEEKFGGKIESKLKKLKGNIFEKLGIGEQE